MNPHFKALEAAYQLHFYLCFKTHYLKPALATTSAQSLIRSEVNELCIREGYHLLETNLTETKLRLLLSLKPTHTISNVAKILKGNLDRQFSLSLREDLSRNRMKKLWARGYFARSSGKVSLETVQSYVLNQVAHHGYKGKWTSPLTFRNSLYKSPAFTLAHSFCLLNYHIVMATQNRIPIFDEEIAHGLFKYLLLIAQKHEFAVERMSLLPDHFHLVIEARPTVSVEECVQALMENTRYWMERHYVGVLKETAAWDLWQPSYYAGTVGEFTSAQIRQFLSLGGE
jgi:putative transposase